METRHRYPYQEYAIGTGAGALRTRFSRFLCSSFSAVVADLVRAALQEKDVKRSLPIDAEGQSAADTYEEHATEEAKEEGCVYRKPISSV